MSEEPPGENVTITRTGLVGQACAHAVVMERTAVQASRSNRISFPCRWCNSMASREAARDSARSHR